jgi:4-aminobutyrate aminotransferase-like enzyme
MFKNSKFFKKFEPPSMIPPLDIYWKKAKGAHIWDDKGKKYIDFTSTIFVTSIGHGNNHFKNKIKEVLNSPISHSYTYYNKFRQEYVQKLIKFVNKKKLNKCFFMSSGTESTEVALKLMRLNAMKKNFSKKGIITISGNWHGRTMGAQMLSDNKEQALWITAKDKSIYHIDFPYPWKKNFDSRSFFKNSIKKKFSKKYNFKKNIAGIVIEAFQGWGAFFYPKNYIKDLVKFAKQNDIYIAIDEMQSGFGRTGKKFAFEHYSFVPDIVCCGKAMGSGMPLSGIISSKKIVDVENGNLQSTHSGNPLSCAAGIATLDEITRLGLVKQASKKGKLMFKYLEEIMNENLDIISHVTGKGLIAALIFKKMKGFDASQLATQICMLCKSKGLLLVNTNRDSIKFGPPLTISEKDIKTSMQILKKSIKEIKSNYGN